MIFKKLLYHITPYFPKKSWITDIQQNVWVFHYKRILPKPRDSCINQLLYITQIYKHFDEGYETSDVSLKILKAFDKVWHKDLLHKLKETNISGSLLNIVTDAL